MKERKLMPSYSYSGIDFTGKKVKGVVDVASKTALLISLRQQKVLVTDVDEVSLEKSKFSLFPGIGNQSKHVPDIFFQLSLLLKSGIALVESLKITADGYNKIKVKKVLMDLASQVSEGKKFSQAMGNHESMFDGMHISLVKVAEKVGRLQEVLMDICEYEENKKKAFDKVKGAMVYPFAVLILGFIIVGFLLSYVVPKMEKVFTSAQRELPASTKMLIGLGNGLQEYGIFIFIFLFGILFAFRFSYAKNKKFRLNIDKQLFGFKIVAQMQLAKLAHVLSFQLKEGLPLTDALMSSSRTLSNSYIQDIVENVIEDVKGGVRFSTALGNSGIFPELFQAAAVTGERSGNLAGIMERVSEFYSKNIDKFSGTFISLVEPIFIVVIGLVVLFIVISIMGPLFELSSFVG